MCIKLRNTYLQQRQYSGDSQSGIRGGIHPTLFTQKSRVNLFCSTFHRLSYWGKFGENVTPFLVHFLVISGLIESLVYSASEQ